MVGIKRRLAGLWRMFAGGGNAQGSPGYLYPPPPETINCRCVTTPTIFRPLNGNLVDSYVRVAGQIVETQTKENDMWPFKKKKYRVVSRTVVDGDGRLALRVSDLEADRAARDKAEVIREFGDRARAVTLGSSGIEFAGEIPHMSMFGAVDRVSVMHDGSVLYFHIATKELEAAMIERLKDMGWSFENE